METTGSHKYKRMSHNVHDVNLYRRKKSLNAVSLIQGCQLCWFPDFYFAITGVIYLVLQYLHSVEQILNLYIINVCYCLICSFFLNKKV